MHRQTAAAFAALLFSMNAVAAEFRWTGMRNPCKQSAEDGLDTRQLGKKIGKFLTLPNENAWAHAIFNVSNRFPDSTPWVTWAVGEVRDAEPLSDETHGTSPTWTSSASMCSSSSPPIAMTTFPPPLLRG